LSTLTEKENESLEDLLLAIVDKLARKEFDLPPLPQVASRVLALTTDPDADASQLTSLIQQDPVLTAKIFQASNSAASGASRKIESLSQAVSWLGLNTIAGSAYALSMQAGVFDVRGYEQEVKGLWTHALATGFYGKAIAGHIGQNPDTAFLCGLLHDIGKPFVVHTVNQQQKNASTRIPWSVMLTLFKDSSKEVGRQLALEWEFPDPVKEAIHLYPDHAYHRASSPTNSTVITNLAHHLASQFVDPQAISDDRLRALPVLQALQLPDETTDALLCLQKTIRAQVDSMLT
jgi:putative nucleotidyltransferase with HDIG domain